MPQNTTSQPFEDQRSIVDFLKKTRLFSPLSDDLLWKLSSLLKFQQLDKSHAITKEGETNSRIFLLIHGQVALYRSGKLIFKLRRGGDILGEISVITNRPCIASEIADTNVLLFSISVKELLTNGELSSTDLKYILFRLFSIALIDKLSLAAHKAQKFEDAHMQSELMLQNLQNVERKAEEAERIKSQFLENINHELRTPMHGIIGINDLLQKTELNPEQREYANIIEESAKALMTVISDLLSLSNIETGAFKIENTIFHVKQLVNETIQELTPKAKEKDLPLLALFDADIPELLEGDASRLQKVLFHLAGNAVKFTHEGEVVINVQLEWTQLTKVKIRFIVTDTGIGIPEIHLKRLFKSFSQVDSSLTREFNGAGLGLIISKQLVEMMGGQIGVDSTEGRGSTFWIALEFQKHQERRKETIYPLPQRRRLTRSSDKNDIIEDFSKKDKQILLVENDRINRLVAAMILEKLGYSVKAVESAEQMVGELTAREYDLVLMDIQLPESDGYEIVRQIRSSQRQIRRPKIPIVALTANFFEIDKQKCRQAGMDDFLAKPIRSDELENVLRRWLTNRTDTTPSIDFNILTQLKENAGKITQITNLFLEELPQKIDRIRQAIEARQPKELAAAAHQLKSNCLTFGAAKAAEICQKLEQEGTTGDLKHADDLLTNLNQEKAKIQTILQNEINGKRGRC